MYDHSTGSFMFRLQIHRRFERKKKERKKQKQITIFAQRMYFCIVPRLLNKVLGNSQKKGQINSSWFIHDHNSFSLKPPGGRVLVNVVNG